MKNALFSGISGSAKKDSDSDEVEKTAAPVEQEINLLDFDAGAPSGDLLGSTPTSGDLLGSTPTSGDLLGTGSSNVAQSQPSSGGLLDDMFDTKP